MAQAAQMDSLLFFVCHEKYAGGQECLKCSIAPGLQIHFTLCCYPARIQITLSAHKLLIHKIYN